MPITSKQTTSSAQRRYLLNLLRRAEVRARKGDYAEAYENLHHKMDQFRNELETTEYLRVRKVLAVCLQGLGETARAAQIYLDILENPPDGIQHAQHGGVVARLHADVCNNLGLIYAQLGRQDAALEQYQRSMALDPSPPEDPRRALTHNNIGLLLHDMGIPLEALEQFRSSLKIKAACEDRRGQANTLDNIGVLLLDSARPRVAEACFRRALKLRSGAPQEQLGLANTDAATTNTGESPDSPTKSRESLHGLGQSVRRRAQESSVNARDKSCSFLHLAKLYKYRCDWSGALEFACRSLRAGGFRPGDINYVGTLLLVAEVLLHREFESYNLRTATARSQNSRQQAGRARQLLPVTGKENIPVQANAAENLAGKLLPWLVHLADVAGHAKFTVQALVLLTQFEVRQGNFAAALQTHATLRSRETALELRADSDLARRRYIRAEIAAQQHAARTAQTGIAALQKQKEALEARRGRLRKALQKRETLLESFKHKLRAPLAELVFRAAMLRRPAVVADDNRLISQLSEMEQDCRRIQTDIHALLRRESEQQRFNSALVQRRSPENSVPGSLGKVFYEVTDRAAASLGVQVMFENVQQSGAASAVFAPAKNIEHNCVAAILLDNLRLFLLNLVALCCIERRSIPRVQVFVSGTYLYLFVRHGAGLAWLTQLLAGGRNSVGDLESMVAHNGPALQRCVVRALSVRLGVTGVRRRLQEGPALALAIPLAAG